MLPLYSEPNRNHGNINQNKWKCDSIINNNFHSIDLTSNTTKQDNPAVERCILPIQYTAINIRAKWFHILIKYENNIINAFHKDIENAHF